MSSRRKGKPVRCIDMICGKLSGGSSGTLTTPVSQVDNINDETEDSLSPEVTDETTNGSSSPVGQGEMNASEADTNCMESELKVDNIMDNIGNIQRTNLTATNPPEGVYILQPESVSDDEEMRTMEHPDNKSSRKRSHEDYEEENINDRMESPHDFTQQNDGMDEQCPGLDLSVKRPRIDGTSIDSYNDFEKTNNMTPHSQSTSPNLFLDQPITSTTTENNEQLEKYHRLMKLVEQQKPLQQAMDEVGLSVHEFFALHRLNNQLTSARLEQREEENDAKLSSAPPTISTSSFEKFSNQCQSIDDDWMSGKAQHDAKIQALLKETSEDVIQQQKQGTLSEAQKLNNSRLQQQPSMVMSSLQDSSVDDRQTALRNFFLKAQGMYSQGTPTKGMMDSLNSTSNSPSMLDRTSMSANDSITAGTVSSGVGSIKKGTLDPSNFDEVVFDQYIAKFTNMNRCGLLTCQYYTRDHYHCVVEDCNYLRFTNKADVIRHYNMHKKRDNSLAHGFLRFSPTEDCSTKYPNCHLNGKSTHYHCMQPDCNKVYTSTSDVMTHENFHKKYMQFVCSGFKRFRATEQCDLDTCTFRDQKTTHFHCTRNDCNFTFKNKCDIEKHKTYHLRDDQYISKGFKKFFKNEACSINDCVWNYTANHFHCLRPGCNFSFTSTSQMESHKRKHERNEYLGDDTAQSRSAQNSPKMPMFNPAMFQEAARKILSIMPPASLPHMISASHLSPQLTAIKSEPSTHYGIPTTSNSGPASPITPLNSRNFQGSYNTPIPKPMMKEEPAWILPPNYEDASHAPSSPSTTQSLPRLEDKQVVTSKTVMSVLSDPDSNWGRGSGVISPSMAISAAAALNPSVTHTDVKISDYSSKPAYEHDRESVSTDDNTVANTRPPALEKIEPMSPFVDIKMNAVSKFFTGVDAYKCWISDCDFLTKRHFHCLIENCEAMFTSQEKVIRHAKFHENLESMGATLPIQNVKPSSSLGIKPVVDRSLSDPPPGYIALQSGMTKQNLTVPEYSKSPPPTNPASPPKRERRSSDDMQPMMNNPQQSIISQYAATGLQYSNANFQSLASQIYANALLKSQMTSSTEQPLSSTPVPAYRLLQNPATLSALMARMSQAASATESSDQELRRSIFPTQKNDSGYVHIKDGMACMRPDCKYAGQNHWHCTMNRCRYVCKSLGKAQTHRQAHDSLDAYARSAKQCFRSYSVKKQCPNPNCEYRLRGHYHCLKPGCTFATIGTSKLPWHMKKHEKIARREASGFKYYTKKEHCNHSDCKYNGLFSHYHCVRRGCTFAFQYKHQMSTHVRKHLRRMLGRTYAEGEDVQNIDHTNVDSGDDSLPLIIDEVEEAEQRPGSGIVYDAREREQLSQQQMDVLERMTQQMKSSYAAVAAAQQDLASENTERDESINTDLPRKLPENIENDESNSDDLSVEHYEALDLSSFAAGSSKSNDSSEQQRHLDIDSMNEDSMSNGHGNMTDEGNMDTENDEGGFQTPSNQSPNAKISPNESQCFTKFKLSDGVLEGFKRFEATDNCGDEKCTYTFKVSHYHCTRENCNYRFTGRSHMFKHKQHHDRVAGLVRDDFKRFKATQLCEDEQCEFRAKNTHFHCLRCDFKCTDSAKVGTHRRQHMKADALEQSGFQRVRGKDDCGREDCKYRCRSMSHFHCLQPGCNYTIVGLTGIELHAEKHKRGLLHRTSSLPNDNTNLIMQNLTAFRNMQQRLLNASQVQNGIDDGGMAHNLSLQTLAAFRNMQNQYESSEQQAPSPPHIENENGHSSETSPVPQNEQGHLLSKFAFLSSAAPSQGPISAASSPVSSMVTEGVGS
ncbi:zinc finger protein castor homolog 1-like [Styela clava]